MKKYCVELYQKIADESWVKESIDRACSIINDIVSNSKIQTKDGNDFTRTREFTALILEGLGLKSKPTSTRVQLSPLKKGTKVRCKVVSWNNSFGYVELLDYKESGSIHIKFITGAPLSFSISITDVKDIVKI